jgi:two-component system, NtrC family, response regulator AtoC
MNGRILIVEDEPEVRDYLSIALKRHGYTTEVADDGDEAIDALTRSGSDVSLMLLDIIMPRKDGLDTLREVRQLKPLLPIVMLSGSSSTPHVIQAMKCGANDFLQKPISFEDLGSSIQKALQARSDTPYRGALVPALHTEEAFVSNWNQKIERFLSHIGESDVPVLLRGETGVGKEVLARQLHARSRRREKPFLKVNCAALPSELVESELFGYERGAFTGAFKASEGRFKQAHGGTIFLDEIGDMDVKLQAKLLQVLQDQEFLRLGAKDATKVDVRVMAATHCNLEESIADGRFREDLYYRLNVINIEIPALRQRKDEIMGLARHLLVKHADEATDIPELSPILKQTLLAHDWPGNIRELENVMRKLIVLRDCEMVCEELQRTRRKVSYAPQALQAPGLDQQAAPAPSSFWEQDAVSNAHRQIERIDPVLPVSQEPHAITAAAGTDSAPMLERVDQAKKSAEASVILSALNKTRWNRRQAADLLQVDYKALLYKMKKLQISA